MTYISRVQITKFETDAINQRKVSLKIWPTKLVIYDCNDLLSLLFVTIVSIRLGEAVVEALRWRHNRRNGVSNHQPRHVYSTVYSGADERKHQSSASLAIVRWIHRGPVNSPHKWPVTRKMFPFDDVIMGFKHSYVRSGRIRRPNLVLTAPADGLA